MYSSDNKACIFSIITSVVRVTWSSEILLMIDLICFSRTFLIIINAENSCAAEFFFFGKLTFRILWWTEGWWKNNIYLKYIVKNIVFTVTFDQFNAFLRIKFSCKHFNWLQSQPLNDNVQIQPHYNMLLSNVFLFINSNIIYIYKNLI